jgi:AcrR family transcriptional regulator
MPKRKVKSENTRNKYQSNVRVAKRLMSQKGHHRTSLEEIAARVSIYKSCLFDYHRNREEIFLEVLKNCRNDTWIEKVSRLWILDVR